MSGVRIEEITEDDELNNQEPIRSSEYTKKRKHEEEEGSNRPIIEEPDDNSTSEPSKKKSKSKKKHSSSSTSLKSKKKGSKKGFMPSMFGGLFGSDNGFPGFPGFGDFDDFGYFDDFDDFPDFGGDEDDSDGGNGGYQCYTSSSSSTVTYDENGVPHIKEKTSSTKSLNGKVEEKTNTLRDSDLGIEKINLERRIGDKSKKIEKVRRNGGAIESKESVKGMTSEEAAAFENDWEKATSKSKGLLKNKKSKQQKLLKN